MIDSAVNNHVRFVKASLEAEFEGSGYDQNGWVSAHGYHDLPWADLVDLWQRHNALLAVVIHRIPIRKLTTSCRIGKNAPVTLGFVIEDYILHMQHHLDHILGREKITSYPSAKQPD